MLIPIIAGLAVLDCSMMNSRVQAISHDAVGSALEKGWAALTPLIAPAIEISGAGTLNSHTTALASETLACHPFSQALYFERAKSLSEATKVIDDGG